MTVINITITESPIQILAGIPKFITATTNIPATIFYTFDGTEPTIISSVLVGELSLPTSSPTLVVKLFATDGVDSSAIITNTYSQNVTSNRNPRDKITGINATGPTGPDPFPFGDRSPRQPVIFGNTGGITVSDPTVTGIPDGFDGTATGTYSNKTDLSLDQYDIKYSETDSIGQRGNGVGTLPATVTITVPEATSEFSDVNKKLFNPKALVIFQDGRDAPEDPEVSLLNRPYFNLENPELARNGILYNNTAFEGAVTHGTFLRPHFNARENTYTFYYRDSLTNRWIISKEPYNPNANPTGSLSQIVFPRADSGAGRVFKWRLFARRVLDAG
jgi:hypothetical protein